MDEHDQRPLIQRQPAECAIQRDAFEAEVNDQDVSTSLLLAPTCLEQEIQKPGFERVRILNCTNATPPGEQRLLCGGCGPVVVAEDQRRGGEEPRGSARCEAGERLAVAASCPLDQLRVQGG